MNSSTALGCQARPAASCMPCVVRRSVHCPALRTAQPNRVSRQQLYLATAKLHIGRPAVAMAAATGQSAQPLQEEQQQEQQQEQQPELEQRSITLRKPVGVVFAQNKGGPVFVEEISAGGNADKSGMVQVGDVLSKCSAVVLKAGKEGQYEREGYGQRPYDNWETVMFDCEQREFKTVMSALKSNNERWGIMNVTLVLRRPNGPQETALCTKAAA